MYRYASCRSMFYLLSGGLVLAGCETLGALPGFERVTGWLPGMTGASAADDTAVSIIRTKPTSPDGVRVLFLSFDVLRADFPLSGMQHSRKVWNHVDELRIDVDLAGRLARNGLRAGVAPAEAAPVLRAIFEAADADLRRERLVAQGNTAVPITLSAIQESESIFSYTDDGRLTGRTFRVGRKLLNIDYILRPELGGATDLRLGLEIRHDRGVLTWQKRAGAITQALAVDRHMFEQFDVSVTLAPGEFLVIGLNDHEQNEYLVGSRFFSFERFGKRYETLLCITPRSFPTARADRDSS